jgi:hypothetical protein
MNTPIALIIFNRPDTTERVFTEIAKAKPPKLFVIADGPRTDHPDDVEKCAATRAIIDRVDWDCEVLKNYSDINLGCGHRPASGISWVFENVEEAIILEDDCMPHPTFYRFCRELLEKYRDDERVMLITGRNLLTGRLQQKYSYHFRRTFSCWGWATWRRAWQHYDFGIKLWPELRETSWLRNILLNERAVEFYRKIFDQAHLSARNLHYWDYQWAFSCWAHSGLAVVPAANLIQNIGFGPAATHTTSESSPVGRLLAEEIVFPLHHPSFISPDTDADLFCFDLLVPKKKRRSLMRYLLRKGLGGSRKLLRSLSN